MISSILGCVGEYLVSSMARYALSSPIFALMATETAIAMIGYADVGNWSPLLPSSNPGEVMSILNKPIVVQ